MVSIVTVELLRASLSATLLREARQAADDVVLGFPTLCHVPAEAAGNLQMQDTFDALIYQMSVETTGNCLYRTCRGLGPSPPLCRGGRPCPNVATHDDDGCTCLQARRSTRRGGFPSASSFAGCVLFRPIIPWPMSCKCQELSAT